MADPQWRIQRADGGILMLILRAFIESGSFNLLYPWLLNFYMRTWTRRLRIDGRRMQYTGSVTSILGTWLKVALLSVVTLSIYWWIRGRSVMQRYMDEHVAWAE